MKCYFAPMEGITGFLYRNAHHAVFGGVDKYFSPFISPGQDRCFTPKEQRDILPENQPDIRLVPQILTNRADAFIRTARALKEYGYDEVNLNLGCPSGTVVSKYKGSGFLAQPDKLREFLDQVFTALDMKISLKTRLGMYSPDEIYELIEIFNQFPLEELVVHPRIRGDFYKNKPNRQVFADLLPLCKSPVCYNGDLFTEKDLRDFSSDFPSVQTIMCGRGLVANPALAEGSAGSLSKERLLEFHDRVYHGYIGCMSGGRNVLFKMKELWAYMICMFDAPGPYAKKIRKAERLDVYEEAVSHLFRSCPLKEDAGYHAL